MTVGSHSESSDQCHYIVGGLVNNHRVSARSVHLDEAPPLHLHLCLSPTLPSVPVWACVQFSFQVSWIEMVAEKVNLGLAFLLSAHTAQPEKAAFHSVQVAVRCLHHVVGVQFLWHPLQQAVDQYLVHRCHPDVHAVGPSLVHSAVQWPQVVGPCFVHPAAQCPHSMCPCIVQTAVWVLVQVDVQCPQVVTLYPAQVALVWVSVQGVQVVVPRTVQVVAVELVDVLLGPARE